MATITDPRADHNARIQEIADAARVRRQLGQAAIHRVLPDGRHEITLHGQTHVGVSLGIAVLIAKEGTQ